MSTILIIEDEKSIVDLISFNLKREGYEILSAEKTKQASTSVTLDNEDDVKMMEKLLGMLEDNEDVQNVWHNWEQE